MLAESLQRESLDRRAAALLRTGQLWQVASVHAEIFGSLSSNLDLPDNFRPAHVTRHTAEGKQTFIISQAPRRVQVALIEDREIVFDKAGFDFYRVRPRTDGVVAQLVEHHNGIVGVRGSNPLGSTILSFTRQTQVESFLMERSAAPRLTTAVILPAVTGPLPAPSDTSVG